MHNQLTLDTVRAEYGCRQWAGVCQRVRMMQGCSWWVGRCSLSISDESSVLQPLAQPIRVLDDGESRVSRYNSRLPPLAAVVRAVWEMHCPHFWCQGDKSLMTPEDWYAEVIEILEEMEHLNLLRIQLNQASNSLHQTILVLCNMRGTVLPTSCRSHSVKMRPIRKPLITEDTRGLQRRI